MEDFETKEFKPKLLLCSCGNSSHNLIIQKFEDKIKENLVYRQAFISVHLDPFRSFKQRLKMAWQVLFKKDITKCEGYAEIIVDKDNIEVLEDLVKFIKG